MTGPQTIRYGHSRKGVQVYKDKTTGKTFTANGALPGRRVPPDQVGAAISMFYGGLSVREIRRTFDHAYNKAPSPATIYEWIKDYTHLAQDAAKEHRAQTTDVWVADEQVQRIGGENVWLWTVMDGRTRYILASHLSTTRTTADAGALFRKAKRRARRAPAKVVTDGLRAYEDGIERVFGGDTRHVVAEGISFKSNNNLMERLNGTIRQRTKVMRGLKTRESALALLEGWALHYNYFKPHEGLSGRTPAQAADVEMPFKNWEDIARQDVRPYSLLRERRERERVPKERRLKERRLPSRLFRQHRGRP